MADLKPGESNRDHGKEATQKPTYPTPVTKTVKRTVVYGTAANPKKQEVEWTQVKGRIAAISGVKGGDRNQYIEMVIGGLPDFYLTENKGKFNDHFYIRHKHLFEAFLDAKAGDDVVFEIEPEVTKDGKNAGTCWQNVEDVLWIRGLEYKEGKPIMPDMPAGSVNAPAPPPGDCTSPEGVFK